MPSAPVPSSTHVQESRHISAPIDKVWEHIRPLTFKWLKTVKEAKVVEGAKESEVGSQRRISYVDGTVQTVKILELSDLQHFVTYEIISSEPAVTVSAATHTIRIYSVTHSDYSNDASADLIQDSKYKKKEAFENLTIKLSALAAAKRAHEQEPLSPKKAKK